MTSNNHMIHLETERATFNLRVVGVFIDSNHVLIHRAEPDKLWTPPGGRAELGESTREALAREMLEEVEVGRLLWVVEYFYEMQGRPFQEVAFYYQAHLPGGCGISPDVPVFYGDDFGLPLIFRWVRVDGLVDELEGLPLYPSFLRTGLSQLPETPQHVIMREED
jgi:ADP-ribose pyrophosphatase YjhB (NUDIX family)